MIDIHSHVLPSVDDGSGSWNETATIFKKMAEVGYTRIVATSHWAAGMPIVPDEIVEKARDLAATFRIELSMARECRIHPQLLTHLAKNPQLRVDGGQVVLVELPWGPVPPYTVSIFGQLIQNGYQPVLAHAARHSELWGQGSTLDSLVDLGVPIQVNLSTINGQHGRDAQRRALRLLEQRRVAIVASDIHSATAMDDAVIHPLHLLERLVGAEAFHILTSVNPQLLLESLPLSDFTNASTAYTINQSIMKQSSTSDRFLSRILNAFNFSR